MASAFGLGLSQSLSEAQIRDWGWRLPFAFGLLTGPVGLSIRRHVHEPANFAQTEKTQAPIKTLFTRQKRLLLIAVGLMVITPLVGLWAEKIGRLPLMWGSLLLLAATIYPAFWLMTQYLSATSLIIAVGWMALLKSVYFSTVPSMMADRFPISTRATGSSLASSYYLMFTALMSVLALWQTQLHHH